MGNAENIGSAHWSYSALNTYLQCPMKYALRYIKHTPEEWISAYFPFGRAFHAVLSQRAVRGADYTLDEAKSGFAGIFKAETDAAGDELVYKPDESYDSCIAKAGDMLAVAFENWQDDYAVKSVAEPFSVTIPGIDRPLVGEFDLVVEEGGKDLCIVDWKTSGSRWPAGKADYDRQATVYCYAYRAKYQVNPVFRYDVITKGRQPQIGNWYQVRTEDELNRFEELLHQVDRSVSAGVFYRNENHMNCAECPYAYKCRASARKGA